MPRPTRGRITTVPLAAQWAKLRRERGGRREAERQAGGGRQAEPNAYKLGLVQLAVGKVSFLTRNPYVHD